MIGLHRRGEERTGPAWGAWIKLPGSESTEILAHAGFDFCIVDLEHTLLDLGAARQHLVVGTSLGLRMLVRVPDASSSTIQRVLDAGADGIIAPHVDTPVAADHVVASTTFPPRGTRGSGGTSRAGRWGQLPREQYLARPALSVVQLESAEAVEAAEAIAATDGLGAMMLGPADLALDPARDTLDPDRPVAGRIIAAARAADIAIGTACALSMAGDQARAGFDFVVCANDTTLLASAAAAAVTTLRGELVSE